MNNNDILRRLRYAFDFSNKDATALFTLDPNSSIEMTQANFLARVAKEEETHYTECSDQELRAFLDGLIVKNRGLKEPTTNTRTIPNVERLSKNDILKKLRIALNYHENDMLETLSLGGSDLSKSELSALFRKPGHKHYRQCGNQVLRHLIKGITLKLRTD